MLRRRLLLEEFSPKIIHIEGKEIDAADALSRQEMEDNEYELICNDIPNPPLR